MQNKLKLLKPIFLWWFILTCVWGGFRALKIESEVVSEIIVKPLVWVSSVLLAVRFNVLPRSVLQLLWQQHVKVRPLWKTMLVPFIGISVYFFAINYGKIYYHSVEWLGLMQSILVNFSTGIVEEFVYRGVLYVWLLGLVDELTAFVIVQLLFLFSHVPILLIRSPSLSAALTQVFFIVLIGAIHTLIFRWSRSVVASSISHGTWNTLAHALLSS